MGTIPWLSLLTLSSSLSTHKTRWPISAKHAAATKPTYPDPTTVIAIDSLILFSGLRLGMGCLDVTTYLGGKPYSNRARWIRKFTCWRSRRRVMNCFRAHTAIYSRAPLTLQNTKTYAEFPSEHHFQLAIDRACQAIRSKRWPLRCQCSWWGKLRPVTPALIPLHDIPSPC